MVCEEINVPSQFIEHTVVCCDVVIISDRVNHTPIIIIISFIIYLSENKVTSLKLRSMHTNDLSFLYTKVITS